MIANCSLQDNKKKKDVPQDNKREKGARGVIRAKTRLIEPRAPLIMSRLPNPSLSFANTF